MKKTKYVIQNLHKGQKLNKNQNQTPYYIENMHNFAIDSQNNIKKRIGTKLVTDFVSNQDIIEIKFLNFYQNTVMLLFTPNKMFVFKKQNNSYNGADFIEFASPWQTKKQVKACAFVEHGSSVYIISVQGSYVLKNSDGVITLESFDFYDGPWHSPNINRKNHIYAENGSGTTYVHSYIDIFESFMEGYDIQIITPNSHYGVVRVLQYISKTKLKVEVLQDVWAKSWSTNWALGGFVAKNEDDIKPIRALIKDSRLFVAYSNPLKGNVVVSVSYLSEFSRFSTREKVGEVLTTPVTNLCGYTDKSGYFYEINDAKEVSFFIESGSYLALGTDNGIFNLKVDNTFTENTKRKTDFAKISNANVAGNADYSDLNSIFTVENQNNQVFLYRKNAKYEELVLNSKTSFKDDTSLSDISYCSKPYRMLFVLQDSYKVLCATCDFTSKETFAWQSFVFCLNTQDSSYIKIHSMCLHNKSNKLYLVIERENGLKNIETLELEDFQHNNLSDDYYLDSCTKVLQNNDLAIQNLEKFIGHNITVIADGEKILKTKLEQASLQLDKQYNNVYIGYDYASYIDLTFNQEDGKIRVNSILLNFNAKSNCLVGFAPFTLYSCFKNDDGFIALCNNYTTNKTIRVLHTYPSGFSLQSIKLNVSLVF